MSRSKCLALLGCGLGLLMPCGVRFALADDRPLAERIATAAPGETVALGAGRSDEPLVIDRSLTLTGATPDESFLEVTADVPALVVTDRAKVTIEGMTIRWQLATSEPEPGPATAILVKDAELTFRNCRIVAVSHPGRCPSGLLADGFSKVRLDKCTVNGFEFAVNIGGGSEGSLVDTLIDQPGHCGATVFADSTLHVSRCVVARSGYHGLRATGGTLVATDNLIVSNENRGVYLGNKSATTTIRNNAFVNNVTGISGFARSNGEIARNVFLGSEFAAIDARDSCGLTIQHNIFQNNERGFALFEESGRNQVTLADNTFWNNVADTEGIERPASSLAVDPQLTDVARGRLGSRSPDVLKAKHGLSDAKVIERLWTRWKKASTAAE